MSKMLCAKAILSTAIAVNDNELPDSIMWMPPGPQDVTPEVNGKPMRLKFTVKPEHAQLFNQQLQDMRASAVAGEGAEPFIDFNHNDDDRAGEVTEFYWGGDDPKTGGVRARVKWSTAGSTAVLGKNYRKFSPQWDFHPTTHEPLYISENLGGLVNRPAFKKSASVIAKDVSASTSNTEDTMTTEEFKKIVDDAMKPVSDRLNTLETRFPASGTATAKAANESGDLIKQVAEGVANGLKPLVERFEKADQDTKKASAKAAVEKHITRGAIAPQDAEGIAGWEASWMANAKFAETQMAKLPGKAGGRMTQVARVEDGGVVEEGSPDPIIAKAHDLVAKSAGRMTFAEALTAAARSDEGQKQYKAFRAGIAAKN